MADKELKPKLKFVTNLPKLIKFNYSEGKKIDKGGTWANGEPKKPSYLYGIVVDGVEKVLFATEALNDLIKAKSPKDKVLKVTKVQLEGAEFAHFEVEDTTTGTEAKKPEVKKDVPF